ncbi:MAG TPA: anion permease, partial [Saprospiraceae bacterium]|nr:anion permease [Saprospiraceae bacterium]
AIKEQGIVAYFISNIEVVNLNPILLVLIFSLATVSISNFMSNTAAATIVIPIGISLLSITSGLDEAIMPICIGLAASCALLLPISTPPNALAYSTGLVEQKEFYPGGILSAIVGPFIIMLFTLAYFFI